MLATLARTFPTSDWTLLLWQGCDLNLMCACSVVWHLKEGRCVWSTSRVCQENAVVHLSFYTQRQRNTCNIIDHQYRLIHPCPLCIYTLNHAMPLKRLAGQPINLSNSRKCRPNRTIVSPNIRHSTCFPASSLRQLQLALHHSQALLQILRFDFPRHCIVALTR